MRPIKPKNIDEYIENFPEETQLKLEQLKMIIKKIVPNAEEVISYQMPAFKKVEVLVYFAGYKNHIGFYPTPSGIKAFQKEISRYKNSKGAVQFPIDKPLPIGLISKMVKYRAKESADKIKNKVKKK